MFEIKFGENEINSVFKGLSIYLSGPDQTLPPSPHLKGLSVLLLSAFTWFDNQFKSV